MNRRERLDKDFEEHNLKFSCNHPVTEVRKRTLSNGSIQYVRQCLRCGSSSGCAIKKAEVMNFTNGVDPQPFDLALMQKWKQESEADYRNILGNDTTIAEEKRKAFWEDYDSYLASAEWQIKRRKVLERAGHICEGCGVNEASQVHHLTYKHLKREFLFELVAVCEECHDILHDEDINGDYRVFLREVIQF